MKVSFFENIHSITPKGRDRDVYYYLDRIKQGLSDSTISKIRVSNSKEQRDTLKKTLPVVAFGGRFVQRSIKGLKEPSGLAILDIDDSKQLEETREKINKLPITFSSWVSPSGNGFKVLVKIPKVENGKEYTARYKALVSHISEDWNKSLGEFDKTSDISRLCFESSDPDLYLNPDSEIFTGIDLDEVEPFNPNIGTITNIPLTDQDEIANKIFSWWKRDHYDSNFRNNSIFKLAVSLNDFGVSQGTALTYCVQFEEKDFRRKEIENIVRSAYKRVANFGTKQFVDSNKKKKLDSLILKGKPLKEIQEEFKDIEPKKIADEVSARKKDLDLDVFWIYDEKGKIDISPHRYKFYLESKDFYKHYPVSGENTFTFLEKEDNFINEINENKIKDYVLDVLLKRGEMNVYDYMAKSRLVFEPRFLSMLEKAEFTMQEDTEDKAYLYFKNTAIEVNKSDKVRKIPYDELDGFVWKKQVVDRDFIETDHHHSEYRTFIWRCSGENVQNYNSLKSVIGYLLHSHKTSVNNRAIIFNDEMISDNPNGGSGKSLFCTAIGKIKNVAKVDGKTFDFQKTFPYQTVPIDSQVLVFDDVKKNFKFENLFSVITEGITLEYKNQPAIKLDIEDSPKIVITTNYTIKGEGGSFERRVFEIEMSSHYNANYTPEDEFGHRLFDHWDDAEWSRFDQFMINCLRYYLQNGLVPFRATNLDLRRIINETDKLFIDWIEGQYRTNERIIKNEFFFQFKNDNSPDFDRMQTTHIFSRWLKSYANFKNYEYVENSTNGQRWFMFKSGDVDEIVWSDPEDDEIAF